VQLLAGGLRAEHACCKHVNTKGKDMRSLARSTLLAIAAMLVGIGCGSPNPAGSTTVGARLGGIAVNALTTRSDVTGVSLSLARTDGGWSSTFSLSNSRADLTGTWSGLFQQIPVGSYGVHASAVDASGAVVFEYASDPGQPVVVSANATAAITVVLQEKHPKNAFANSAPYFVSLLASKANTDSSQTVQLSAVAADPDGDKLEFSWVSDAGGAFSGQNDTATTSAVSFKASADGSYKVTVAATDPSGAQAQISMSIQVSSANQTGNLIAIIDMNGAPVVTDITSPNAQAGAVSVRAGSPISLTATATDPDGDALSFQWAAGNDDAGNVCGSFAGQKDAFGRSDVLFTVTTAQAWGGSCAVTVTVSDGRGGTNTGTLQIGLLAPTVAGGPQFYVTAVSPVYIEVGQRAEVKVVPGTGSADWSWTYAWTDGLQAPFQGAFAPNGASGADQLYAPASCDALGFGDHVVKLGVTVTDPQSGASNQAVLPVTVHCPTTAWAFGVISDTQWIGADDGRNPGTSAVDIIQQVDKQFVQQGVKLVVAVGDLTDSAGQSNMDVRAVYTQDLYNAGIGFFPLRGNHDSTDAAEFKYVFPQTQGGMQNATPADALTRGSTAPGNKDVANQPVPVLSGGPFAIGTSFSSPASAVGFTYAFDYQNVHFVLLDQFDATKGTALDIAAQQPWIDTTLSTRPAGSHAFVFGHKGLITENHVDNLFGANPAVDPAGTNAFINSLANNGARLYTGGHDHMHDRTLVTTTDGVSNRIMQLVAASDSSKFYIPAVPSNDDKYDVPAFQTATFDGHRQTALAQELNTVGYYVYTLDGPRATVDFYSAVVNPTLASGEYLISTTPALTFTKRESFGYSLNGKEFVVPQGGSYTVVQDAFQGTTAAILGGVNGDLTKDGSGRAVSHAVDTGWTKPAVDTASSILTLWGMTTVGAAQTDVYALSMSYDPTQVTSAQAASQAFGLAVRDGSGHWFNAVDRIVGGAPKTFVNGPWNSTYGLGRYGVDPATHTVWAVINYTGDFAAASF
jgi:hypothetical protein